MKKMGVLLAVIAVLAPVLVAGVFGARAEGETSFSVDWQAHAEFTGDEEVSLRFSPAVSGTYDLYAFDGEGIVRRAVLRMGDRIIARGAGDGLIFSTGLIAGQDYTLELVGTGGVGIELMRHALGRSIMLPEPAQSGYESGMIVLPGNAKWYSIDAQAGRVSVYVTPERPGSMRLSAEVYTADGRLVQSSSDMAGGGCRLYFEAEESGGYRLRIACGEGGTGAFEVRTSVAVEEAPDSLEIMTEDLTLHEGDMRSIRARIWPLDADSDMEWVSSDTEVAEVNAAGVVTALSPGTAEISVYAYGGLRAAISVTVLKVEPEYIAYRGDFITLRVGDVLTPSMQVYPAAAADDARITYESSAPEIVAVSDTGELTALAEGTAEITVSFGVLSDRLSVDVDEAPARYRALFVSEQNYAQDVNSMRVGAANTAYNLESLFSMASYDGEGCRTTVEVDLTAEETLAAIEEAFAGAVEKDISIFYISCHGYYENGMTILQFVDGSELAACDLERALRKVPGTVVVIADCCDSGGLISTYGGSGDISGGIVTAFAGETAVFSSSKYKVLASAALGEDSYRLGYASDSSEAITVFAWALCDALGWDVDDQRRGPLSADTDYDGEITLWEAYLYTKRRVMWYLSRAGSGYVQSVQVYPEGDMFTLFERE